MPGRAGPVEPVGEPNGRTECPECARQTDRGGTTDRRPPIGAALAAADSRANGDSVLVVIEAFSLFMWFESDPFVGRVGSRAADDLWIARSSKRKRELR